MKVEKEVLIFRSEKELNEYVIKLVRPTSQVAVEDGEGAKYPATVDVIHTYGRKYDDHRIIFRKPGRGLIDWFKQSNRWKHLLYGFLVALIAGFAFTCGAAAGMEFKDNQWGGKWDWIDFGLTVAGALVGAAIRYRILNVTLGLTFIPV
ncbi:hypothetical protein HNL05_42 [Bacteroides phage HNL05]|nr:hypothetical protein HNL05_42 [Bacteroides phage HNL05]